MQLWPMMKKRMNYIVPVLAALLLAAAVYFNPRSRNAKAEPFIPHVHDVFQTFFKEMRQEEGLYNVGACVRVVKKIDAVYCDFWAFRPATVEEARKLEIKAIQKLAALVNSYEKLRPFLRERPFPPSRIEIIISFHTNDGGYYEKDSIGVIYQEKNQICYKTRNFQEDKFVLLKEEKWEDAMKIANAEQQASSL